MKFTIEKKPFAELLGRLTRVVERRNTYPILANVLIIAEGDEIRLRATDLDIEISESVAAGVIDNGTTTVEARLLSDIVRKMPDGSVITFEADKDTASIKAGRSKFNLMTIDPASFPDLKSGQFLRSFPIDPKQLLRIIDRCAFAISNEETRYYLNGIYFHVAEDEQKSPVLRGVATDGHRMSRCEMPLPDGAAGIPGIIVPKKTIGEFARLLEGATEASLDISDTKIRLSVGNTVLMSKLIEGTFPDYQRVTPQLSNNIAAINANDLKKAIDRVTTVASDRGGKAVKFRFEDHLLELEVTNPDHGTSQEDMAAEWEGDKFEIGFNANYCKDALDQFKGDTVRMSMADPGSPVRIWSQDDRSTLIVLMPMRV